MGCLVAAYTYGSEPLQCILAAQVLASWLGLPRPCVLSLF